MRKIKHIPSTEAQKARVRAITDSVIDRVAQLACRWQDEKEFEDWADYVTELKKLVPSDCAFVRAQKSKFGFIFKLNENGGLYRIYCGARAGGWDRP